MAKKKASTPRTNTNPNNPYNRRAEAQRKVDAAVSALNAAIYSATIEGVKISLIFGHRRDQNGYLNNSEPMIINGVTYTQSSTDNYEG